ncbi:MAG: hypothetical protein EOO47_01175 [Flavobacterium sp.]|nr:MAG: hypothetical protein EOO47_01175 [Flavobacterium sp.]
MKKITLLWLSLFSVSLSFAQQKYQAFNINGKYGITDTLGNEAIKPIYKYVTNITAKNQIYLQDFSEKPDIIFNAKTGAKQSYESVYNGKLSIKDVQYSIITSKGKKFLLSEETDKTIPFSRDYDEFYSAGKYIIAKYYAQEPFVSGGKDKNGRFLPPPIREMKRHHVVLTNDETLKTVVGKSFDKYLPLYKTPEEKNDDRIVKVETITLSVPVKKSNPVFDYIVLSQGNNHRLYNAKMVLVKAFVLAKADEDKLLDYAQKLLKISLTTMASEQHGMVSAPPMMASPSMGGRRNSDAEPEEKKPFKPFFYIKQLENGNTIFALQETEEISKRIFEAKPTSKVKLYTRSNEIYIDIKGKETSRFYYNPTTGEIYLPKAYLAELGITLI